MKKEIAKNVSSGAKKVETIEHEKAAAAAKASAPAGAKKAKNTAAKSFSPATAASQRSLKSS